MGAPTIYSEDWGKVDETVEEVTKVKTEETPKVEPVAKTEETEIPE